MVVAGTQPDEVCVLAVPAGGPGGRLRELSVKAVAPAQVRVTDSAEDIIFYRELPRVRLAQLPQLGPQAREAYRQLARLDNFTPHARTDVPEWAGAGVP